MILASLVAGAVAMRHQLLSYLGPKRERGRRRETTPAHWRPDPTHWPKPWSGGGYARARAPLPFNSHNLPAVSSLWTPEGERPVGRPEDASPSAGDAGPPGSGPGPDDQLSEEQLSERLAELRQQLADTPAESVVANHCYGLFELGALHMSINPPQLDQARVAIDALACLVEGLEGRLGAEEANLKDGLAQLRMAFVQIQTAQAVKDGDTQSGSQPAQ